MKHNIYFDSGATTKVDDEVIAEISNSLREDYANPSSLHFMGVEVNKKIENARKIIAKSINAGADEIFFVASGSEADNLCIKGYCEANKEKGNHIITSSIEHPAVIKTYENLREHGFEVTYLEVDNEGFVDFEELKRAIKSNTLLVSIMHANNEIGTVQDIEAIAEFCKTRNIAFHTDAVQSYLKVPIDVKKMNISLASFSGHKIHVPKGIGFIYVRKGIDLKRQVDGGGQESQLRAGTENTPYILGLVKAITIFSEEDVKKIKKMQNQLIEYFNNKTGFIINGPTDLSKRVCNNVNISSSALSGEMIMMELSKRGICVSTGSACSSKSSRVSPVLDAINCDPQFIHGNIRITLSKYNSEKDVEILISEINKIVEEKNKFSLNEISF